jgi:two-component system sensor histidine kinase SenX3
MRLSRRAKKIAFFVTLGACLVGLAIALNVTWIVLKWREVVPLVLGIIFFALIIAGIVVYTVFLVREIHKNEQQDSFLNAVTHELKTPIASLRLYLETLQTRQLTEAQRREFYRIMLEDTDRLLGTVEQVLKASQVSNKPKVRVRSEVDLGNLARECMELARTRHRLPPDALRYQESVNGTRPLVLGDPENLRTAVSNVLDNAIKYSGDKVNVSVEVGITDEKNVELRIRDRGVGIPADELKRIFKRFYRVPGRAQSQVKGTGLGLFIVRSIAKAHGGKVFAESGGESRGTTITIELPRSTA